jgi:hypothetical protein
MQIQFVLSNADFFILVKQLQIVIDHVHFSDSFCLVVDDSGGIPIL